MSLLHFRMVEFLTVSSLSDDPVLFVRNGTLVLVPRGEGEASASFLLPQGGRLEGPGRHPHLVPWEGAPPLTTKPHSSVVAAAGQDTPPH